MTDTPVAVPLERLSVSDFEPLVGQTFSVIYPERTEVLTLTAAKASRRTPPAGQRQTFTLEFEGTSTDMYLPQKVHPLDHEKLGRLDLFLVPVGRTPGGACCYEAVFT